MLSSLFEMVRKERKPPPSGQFFPVDEAWKKDVLQRMRDKGISRADLAREIDVDPAALTNLFKPWVDATTGKPKKTKQQSRLVPKIHKALGMVEPEQSVIAIANDDAFRRLKKIWSKLTDEQREHLIKTGQLLSGANS